MEIHYRPDHHPLVPPGAIEHHVTDMTATFSADVTLAHADEELARADQWLPVDGGRDLPLGRLVEENSTGPMRLGFGGWRDLLLGAQFRNGRGDLITAGGRTVKNVAGYDLTKFMVGQRGVFGRVVTITTRTYRRPDGAVLARFPLAGNIRQTIRKFEQLMTTHCRPQWALLSADALLCGYLSDERTLAYIQTALPEYQPSDVRSLSVEEDIQLRLAARGDALAPSAELHARVSVPPSYIGEFVEKTSPTAWIADPAFGVIWASYNGDSKMIENAAQIVGGSAILTRLDGTLVNVTFDPVEKALLERLKYAFDPDGRLAPLPMKG
jgi:FAD/FMN-containing dehydrogenase